MSESVIHHAAKEVLVDSMELGPLLKMPSVKGKGSIDVAITGWIQEFNINGKRVDALIDFSTIGKDAYTGRLGVEINYSNKKTASYLRDMKGCGYAIIEIDVGQKYNLLEEITGRSWESGHYLQWEYRDLTFADVIRKHPDEFRRMILQSSKRRWLVTNVSYYCRKCKEVHALKQYCKSVCPDCGAWKRKNRKRCYPCANAIYEERQMHNSYYY